MYLSIIVSTVRVVCPCLSVTLVIVLLCALISREQRMTEAQTENPVCIKNET